MKIQRAVKNTASYDESYLNKLIKEREVIERKVSNDQINREKIQDSVSLNYSSRTSKNKSN